MCYMLHATDKPSITGKKLSWTEIGAKLECHGYDGEIYLESSRGKVPTLAECKDSCESAAKCQSISYFKSGWCSHWSTPCAKTKWNKKVSMSLRLSSRSNWIVGSWVRRDFILYRFTGYLAQGEIVSRIVMNAVYTVVYSMMSPKGFWDLQICSDKNIYCRCLR